MSRQPNNQEKDLLLQLHSEGRCISYIAGYMEMVHRTEINDDLVHYWYSLAGLKPNVPKYGYRSKIKLPGVKLIPVRKENKVQPVAAQPEINPINIAVKELRLNGKKIPEAPIEIIREANRIRKANGKQQIDRVADWIV